MAERPDDEIMITWIKGNVSRDAAQAVERAGGFTQIELAGNEQADLLAKRGASMHRPPKSTSAFADDRRVLANLVQRMMIAVWTSFFSLHEDDWEQEGEDAPERGLPINELYGSCEATGEAAFPQGQRDANSDGENDIEVGRTQASWTTAQIARCLKARPGEYCWELLDEECDTKIVLAQLGRGDIIDHTPGASVHIKGRGKVDCGIDASPIVIEAVKWWMNQLRWTPHWASRPQERPSHAYTATFAEMVVDCEAATGIELPAPRSIWRQ